MSSAQRSEVKAWEEEIVPCQHMRELVQPEPKKLEPAGAFPTYGCAFAVRLSSSILSRRSRLLCPRRLRPHLELVALLDLRRARLRSTAVRRWRRQRARAEAHQRHRSSCCREARDHRAGWLSRSAENLLSIECRADTELQTSTATPATTRVSIPTSQSILQVSASRSPSRRRRRRA